MKPCPFVGRVVTSVSSIALGGLQVVALLLPVVILTTRFLAPQLAPTGEERLTREKKLEWLQTWIVFGSLGAIILLSIGAVLLVWTLITTYDMSNSLFFGFLLLMGGILLFVFPVMLVVYDQRKLGNIPSIDPPE